MNRLVELGWDAIVVWECETRELEALAHRLVEFIGRCEEVRMRQVRWSKSPAEDGVAGLRVETASGGKDGAPEDA